MNMVDKTETISRYIYTKIDGNPHYLIMSKCNFCPFLINSRSDNAALCSRFIDVVKPNTEEQKQNHLADVYGYMYHSLVPLRIEILSEIKIPDWCGLNTSNTYMSPNGPIYSFSNGKLLTESGQRYFNVTKSISDKSVMISTKDGESLLSKPKVEINPFNTKVEINPLNTTTPIEKPKIQCSSCGEGKDGVKRDTHDGMCGVCWDSFKRNKQKRYISKINNFRLKRKVEWLDQEFRMVK